MESVPGSPFRRAALASKLIDAAQLAEAEAAVRKAMGADPLAEVADEQLAAMLVGMGRLNQWQAEQLKAGRSKFTLGPYQVVDSLGQGGMGQVFKAEHPMLGRTVAVKVLPISKSTPAAIASFNREMRAQAQLDHQHLVRAYDAGHDGNVYYLVTEYVPGTDLRKLVRDRGPLPMHEAAGIISQAAQGLSHAHQRGLIHRDVKPGNLLVTPAGECKVSDLGLAGFLGDENDPRATRTVGTADYLSPEHILTPGQLTPASDVYSLGCTLYYAVTGKVPFPGGTTKSKLERHCRSAPLNPRNFNPDLSDDFLDVLAAMMEKDPAKRVATGLAVVERLAPWASGVVEPAAAEKWSNPLQSGAGGPAATGDVSETQPEIFAPVFGRTDESPSQFSQGTESAGGYGQETLPERPAPPAWPIEPLEVPVRWVALALLPVALAAAALLTSLLLQALR